MYAKISKSYSLHGSSSLFFEIRIGLGSLQKSKLSNPLGETKYPTFIIWSVAKLLYPLR